MHDFIYRDARPEDRDEVLAFTAHTWEHGDYISFVYDDWQADPMGRFLVIEDRATGRIAGIDKLTMLSPHEAWFEGLRIREEYRGRGLATHVQRYMIGEARRLGARTIRFITRVGNTPIHLAGYRDGFVQTALVRGFAWHDGADANIEPDSDLYSLRRATPAEAPRLYQWWRRSSAYRTAGLVNSYWSLQETSQREWETSAANGYLWVRNGPSPETEQLPVPCVLLLPGGEKEENAWTVSAVCASYAEWSPLLRGLLAAARSQGIGTVEGLLPDEHLIYTATMAADITPDSDGHCHCLFELDLTQ